MTIIIISLSSLSSSSLYTSDVYNLQESPHKMDSRSGLSNLACLLQIGLQPMVFDVKIVNGSICGVLTGVNSEPIANDYEVDEEITGSNFCRH